MSTLVKCVCLRLIPASRIFTFYCADRELIAERWEAGAGSLSAGRVNGLRADEILSLSVLLGIRPPCPIFPPYLFLLLLAPLDLISPGCLPRVIVCTRNSELAWSLERLPLFFLFPLLFNFNFTESERMVIVRPDENDSLRVWIGSRGLGGRVHLVLLQLQELFDVRWHQMAQSGQASASAKLRRQRPRSSPSNCQDEAKLFSDQIKAAICSFNEVSHLDILKMCRSHNKKQIKSLPSWTLVGCRPHIMIALQKAAYLALCLQPPFRFHLPVKTDILLFLRHVWKG